MSEVIDIAGSQFIIGMDWSLPPNKSSQSETLKNAGKRVMHIAKPSDDGILLGIAQGKVPANAVPAALALASVKPDAIIFHEFEPDRIWLCAIMQSTPLSGMDVILSATEARKRFSEQMSHQPGATLIGTLNGASMSVEEVMAQVEVATIKALKLRQSGVSPVKMAVLASVPLLMAGGFYAYQQWQQHIVQLRDAADRAQAMLLQQESERSKLQRQGEAFQSNLQRERDALTHGVPAHALFAQFRDAVLGLDQNHEGYRLDEAVCERQLTGASQCKLTWKTKGGANSRALPTSALTLPGAPSATQETDPMSLAGTAYSTLNLPAVEPQEMAADGPGMAMSITSKAQLIGVEPVFKPATPVVVTPEGAAKGGQAPAAITLGKRGQWTAQMSSLDHAAAFVSMVKGSSLRLRQVSFEGMSGNRIRIRLEGDYVSQPSQS